MSISSPHYLLFSEACHAAQPSNAWRFVLESVDSQQRLAATDVEPHAGAERLELLAVVRGLEALDGPTRVTLITKSRYVSRGLKYGMNEWRMNSWQWERFGKIVPVRDHDLWRRVDRALQFHQVECRAWQFASESDQNTRPLPKHSGGRPDNPPSARSAPAKPSLETGRFTEQTRRSPAESRSGKDLRKSNRQEPRRRSDPSHRSRQGKPARVDTPTRSKRSGSTQKTPNRNPPVRPGHLSRQVQRVMARLKWSLAAWLSERRLQPLA